MGQNFSTLKPPIISEGELCMNPVKLTAVKQ